MRERWDLVGEVHSKITCFKDGGNIFAWNWESKLKIRLGKKTINSLQCPHAMCIK